MRRSAGTLLAHLLDQESEALRSGNLSALTPIATEKSKILVNLESERVKPSDIATIRAKAARNEALLAAAIRGVKTARDRIAELDVVKNDLRIYGQDGSLLNAKRKSSAIERKA